LPVFQYSIPVRMI